MVQLYCFEIKPTFARDKRRITSLQPLGFREVIVIISIMFGYSDTVELFLASFRFAIASLVILNISAPLRYSKS